MHVYCVFENVLSQKNVELQNNIVFCCEIGFKHKQWNSVIYQNFIKAQNIKNITSYVDGFAKYNVNINMWTC